MTRLRAGLASVTLRAVGPRRVVEAASSAGLGVVEWGADVHVPPGSEGEVVRDVLSLSAAAGVRATSYGSYLRPGSVEVPAPPLREAAEAVLGTAEALGVDRVRVWAGDVGSAEAGDGDRRRRVVDALRTVTDLAAARGLEVGLEYHAGTQADSAGSTLRLLDEVDRPGLRTYWQPPVGMPAAAAVADLAHVLHQVSTVHAFSWTEDGERLPLRAREGMWRDVLAVLREGERAHDVLLEFVAGDDLHAVLTDGADLAAWVGDA